MASSTVVKNFADGTLLIEDGSGTPIACTMRFAQGNLTLQGLAQKQREVAAYESRGEVSSVRHTTRKFISGSFTGQLSEFTSATANNIIDAFMKKGAFAAGVSRLGASADVWAVKLTFTVEGTAHGDSADHVATIDKCVGTVDVAEGDPNTVTINLTSYDTQSPTIFS